MFIINWFLGLFKSAEAAPAVKDDAVQEKTPVPLPVPKAQFDVSMTFVLKNEGGFVNDHADRGGATNYGITEATYARYKGRKVTPLEVKAMTLEDAKAIYRMSYWNLYFEQVAQPVATAIFDWSVLHGPVAARELAQSVANSFGAKLKVDGVFGPITVTAINRVTPKAFVDKYAAEVKAYFLRIVASNPTQKKFLNGWEARARRMADLA